MKKRTKMKSNILLLIREWREDASWRRRFASQGVGSIHEKAIASVIGKMTRELYREVFK